jgi:hypothetical protein
VATENHSLVEGERDLRIGAPFTSFDFEDGGEIALEIDTAGSSSSLTDFGFGGVVEARESTSGHPRRG